MCACEPGYKCAAHRAYPDHRCDDYPELPDERRSPWETDDGREAARGD